MTAKEKVFSLIEYNINAHNQTLEIASELKDPDRIKAVTSISILERLKMEINKLDSLDSLEKIDRECKKQNQPGIPIHLDDDFLKWTYHCASKLINDMIGVAMNTWSVMQPEDKLVLGTQKQILFDFIEELSKIDRSME